MNTLHPRTKQGLVLLGYALVAATIIGIVGFQFPGEDHDPIIGALLSTGRFAFLVFLIPLFARPLRTLVKNSFTAALMRWRRNAGIVYGGIQTIHLFIVAAMFLLMTNPPTETIMVIIGSLGLLLALGMLLTSFPAPTKALGPKNWKTLHKTGFYIFMVVYFYDFVVEPILLDNPTSHLFWGALTVAGMLVRIIVMFRHSPRVASGV